MRRGRMLRSAVFVQMRRIFSQGRHECPTTAMSMNTGCAIPSACKRIASERRHSAAMRATRFTHTPAMLFTAGVRRTIFMRNAGNTLQLIG
jgi:hypothetical protein